MSEDPPREGPGSPGAGSRAAGSVSLPSVGSGERRRRRTAKRGAGRRRAAGFAAVVIAFLVALAGLLDFGYRSFTSVDDDPPAREATDTTEIPEDGPAPPRALLVQQAEDGGVVGVTVLVVGEGGTGGDLVFAPVGSMVEVPSFGLSPLREAFQLGGLPLLQHSVENLLGFAFDQIAMVGPADIVALVEPAGVLRVELPGAVEVVTDAGRIETIFPAGPVDVAPDGVPALLEQRGSGSDLDRLVRHQAFWRAWLAAIAGNPSASPEGGIGEIITAIASGEVGQHLLPVEVMATGTGPKDDLYAVKAAELDALVAEIAPGADGGARERIRVQVLNGTGVPGLAQQVQPLLVPAGALVSLTGNADRDYETTQVVFYRDEHLDAARAVQRALGVGEVVRSLVALTVVDVTVVIGADFAAEGTTTTTAEPGA